MPYSLILSFFTVLLFFAASSAHADYYVWEHEQAGIEITFPDTWKMTHNQNPDDILTILGPTDFKDHPKCILSKVEDRRYSIFPPEYARSVQQTAYSDVFWNDYFKSHHHNVTVHQFGDHAGLGRGAGSYVIYDYDEMIGKEKFTKTALGFAALHNNTAYMLTCSALREGFGQWRPLFQSIAESVDMQAIHSPRMHGYYRDFTK